MVINARSVKQYRKRDGTVVKTEVLFTHSHDLLSESNEILKSAKIGTDHNFINGCIRSIIILRYAAIEARLNEVIHRDDLLRKAGIEQNLIDIIEVIRSEGLQSKKNSHALLVYNMLLRIFGKEEIPKDEDIYQSVNLIRHLRNTLVHPIPEWIITQYKDENFDYSAQQDIVKKLKSRLHLDTRATFPTSILTLECAEWVKTSVDRYLETFHCLSGIPNLG